MDSSCWKITGLKKYHLNFNKCIFNLKNYNLHMFKCKWILRIIFYHYHKSNSINITNSYIHLLFSYNHWLYSLYDVILITIKLDHFIILPTSLTSIFYSSESLRQFTRRCTSLCRSDCLPRSLHGVLPWWLYQILDQTLPGLHASFVLKL